MAVAQLPGSGIALLAGDSGALMPGPGSTRWPELDHHATSWADFTGPTREVSEKRLVHLI